MNEVSVEFVAKAAGSWLALNAIRKKFGASPDGAVERDIAAAESRLLRACAEIGDSSYGRQPKEGSDVG